MVAVDGTSQAFILNITSTAKDLCRALMDDWTEREPRGIGGEAAVVSPTASRYHACVAYVVPTYLPTVISSCCASIAID